MGGISIPAGVDTVDGIKGAVTLANLAAFTRSIGGNGYQKLPGGLILQWGYVYVGGARYATAGISYPIAMNVLAVGATTQSVTSAAYTGGGALVNSVSNSGFNMASGTYENVGICNGFYWWAVGY